MSSTRSGSTAWTARWLTRTLVLVLAGLVGAAVPACARPDDPAPGSLAAGGVSLAGQTYRVGGKTAPEQRVLCALTLITVRSLGATGEDRCDIPDVATRSALAPAGAIDIYWEYTGTAAGTFLGPLPQDRIPRDPQKLWTQVRDTDAAANDVAWLRPTPFDDTYAIAAPRAVADRLGVRTLSDWARLVQSGSPEATTCIEPEFARRPDGLISMLAAYDVTRPYLGPPEVTVVDADVVYSLVTAASSPCSFGEVFSTDGRIGASDLVLLRDDRGHFPPYNAAPTVRREVLDRAPALGPALDAVSARLTDDVIRDLNAQVSPGGRDPEDVAFSWLTEQGLVGRQ